MTDDNPIKKIEDEKAMNDLGKMALLVYRGAIEAGAEPFEAYFVTAAYFRGMFGGSLDQPSEEN